MPRVQSTRGKGARDALHPYKHPKNSASRKGAATFYGSDALETDKKRLAKRQKQVDYGKNTIGYTRYLARVPRAQRTRDMPHTPDIRKKMSKRAFDGLIAQWRRRLHDYDPNDEDGEDADGGGSENVGVLEDQRRAEAEAMAQAAAPQLSGALPSGASPNQKQQQQHSQPPQKQLHKHQIIAESSANASTPGGQLTTTSTTTTAAISALPEFDEFEDMDDLTEYMEEYGLTRAQILEAARVDPEFLELLRGQGHSSITTKDNGANDPNTSASAATSNPVVADVNFEESDEDFNFEDDDLL